MAQLPQPTARRNSGDRIRQYVVRGTHPHNTNAVSMIPPHLVSAIADAIRSDEYDSENRLLEVKEDDRTLATSAV
jgi:hypothetical protein